MLVIVETPRCCVCRKTSTLEVEADGYAAWKRGALIQRALPSMSADQREMLLTGTHPECWDDLFDDGDCNADEIGCK